MALLLSVALPITGPGVLKLLDSRTALYTKDTDGWRQRRTIGTHLTTSKRMDSSGCP